jgi:hypothetical protein
MDYVLDHLKCLWRETDRSPLSPYQRRLLIPLSVAEARNGALEV